MLKEIDKVLEKFQPSKKSKLIANSNENLLTKEEKVVIEELWLEYLAIYENAKKNGIKDRKNMLTYTEILVKNRSIPSFILENSSSVASKESLKATISNMMKDYSKWKRLLSELTDTLKQEIVCSTMNPSRVKNVDEKKVLESKCLKKSYKEKSAFRNAKAIEEEKNLENFRKF